MVCYNIILVNNVRNGCDMASKSAMFLASLPVPALPPDNGFQSPLLITYAVNQLTKVYLTKNKVNHIALNI